MQAPFLFLIFVSTAKKEKYGANNDVVSFPPNTSIVHNSNAGAVPSSYRGYFSLLMELYIARIIRQLEANCALFCTIDILHSIPIALYAVEVKIKC